MFRYFFDKSTSMTGMVLFRWGPISCTGDYCVYPNESNLWNVLDLSILCPFPFWSYWRYLISLGDGINHNDNNNNHHQQHRIPLLQYPLISSNLIESPLEMHSFPWTSMNISRPAFGGWCIVGVICFVFRIENSQQQQPSPGLATKTWLAVEDQPGG